MKSGIPQSFRKPITIKVVVKWLQSHDLIPYGNVFPLETGSRCKSMSRGLGDFQKCKWSLLNLLNLKKKNKKAFEKSFHSFVFSNGHGGSRAYPQATIGRNIP